MLEQDCKSYIRISLSPKGLCARILTVPPQRVLCSKDEVKDPGGCMKEEQFGFLKTFISVTSSDEKRNPA